MTSDREDHQVFPARWRVQPAHPGTGPGPPGGLLPRGVRLEQPRRRGLARFRGRHRPRDRSLHPRPARRRARPSPPLRADPPMRPSTRSRPTAAPSSALRSQKATCGSRQSRIPQGTCLASGSGDPATGDVIRGVQNGGYLTAIDDRRCRDGRTRIGARDRRGNPPVSRCVTGPGPQGHRASPPFWRGCLPPGAADGDAQFGRSVAPMSASQARKNPGSAEPDSLQ
jgi:hypothetical protein